MALYNNFLKPTFVPTPISGGEEVNYFTDFFMDTDIAVLSTTVNDFYAALRVNGLAWPYIIGVEYTISGQGANTCHHVCITYLTIGGA
jgi:hypothetical protein